MNVRFYIGLGEDPSRRESQNLQSSAGTTRRVPKLKVRDPRDAADILNSSFVSTPTGGTLGKLGGAGDLITGCGSFFDR